MINIAIDGPSGAGKSTLAKALAADLGYIYVDTGAMYRAIGLYVFRCGITPTDAESVTAKLPEIKITLSYENGTQKIALNGEDVSSEIRMPDISMYASHVSAIPEVRSFLLNLQRDLAAANNVIMDGRDIGTVILPSADLKIFLTASPEARARRRYRELCERGETVTFEEVFEDMQKRDTNDSTRKVAPAIPAKDAIHLDNSELTLADTVLTVKKLLEEKVK